MNRKLISLLCISGVALVASPAFAGGGEADYNEHNPPVASTASRDQVVAETLAARAAGQIQRGEFLAVEQGVITVASVVSREQVQRETVAALRAGTVPRGESVEQDQGVMQLAGAYLAANPVMAQAPTTLEPARPEGEAPPVASLASPAVETVAMMPVRREEEAGVVEGASTDVVRQ